MSMISELKDEEILDFLMTSDFEEDYKPEELKYLLVKWRYFYRLLNGRYEISKVDLEGEVKKLKEELGYKDNKIESLMIEGAKKDDLLSSLKNKKLSWKERISGKINKDNEDRRV